MTKNLLQPLLTLRLQLLAHQELTSVIIQMDVLTMCCATMHRHQTRAAWMLRLKKEAEPPLSRVGQKQYGSSISNVQSVSCTEDVDMCGGSVRDPAFKHENCFELWVPQRLPREALHPFLH